MVEESRIEKVKRVSKSVKNKIFGYIAAGLGLVAGLAWNDAVKSLIDYFLPDTASTIIAKIIYAFVITVIVGLVLYFVEKSLEEGNG